MTGEVINHLWQSTWFAVAAGLLAAGLRKNRAQVRYWLWFSASVKFLIPFSLLMSLGSRVEWAPPATSVSHAMVEISRPFSGTLAPAVSIEGTRNWVFPAIAGLWICGLICVAAMRVRGWLRIRAAVRASAPMDLAVAVEVRSSKDLLEPGVVGVFRPILLVPVDITERLSPQQLEAVLAHELCHVRRRDNLTAAVHMITEAVFWFHPLVWWVGARLVQERERACDEEVLRLGMEPHAYAQGILNICTSYLESPLSSVSGVTGSDLKKRIRAILNGSVPRGLNVPKRVALAVAAVAALASPVVIGMMNAPAMQAQTQNNAKPNYLEALGSVSANTVTVKPRVDGQLLSVHYKEGDVVKAGQLMASIDARPYDLQLQRAEGALMRDLARHADAGTIQADQADVESARLQLTYSQVTAPIAGVVGLRMVEIGNVVHAADSTGLFVINQLQPIAVLFNVEEDLVPRMVARLKSGTNLTVEAWTRDEKRIAVGRLTAVDNQIDATTGMVKLKAVFDNKDGALFPNQFVLIHLPR